MKLNYRKDHLLYLVMVCVNSKEIIIIVVEANLKTLEQLILEQRIHYDYNFYKIPFDVDFPLIILSKKISKIFKVSPILSVNYYITFRHLTLYHLCRMLKKTKFQLWKIYQDFILHVNIFKVFVRIFVE